MIIYTYFVEKFKKAPILSLKQANKTKIERNYKSIYETSTKQDN